MANVQKSDSAKSLTLELHAAQDDTRPVYITGSFNGWKTADPAFQMTRHDSGRYSYTFFDFSLRGQSLFEYKYIKGGWEGEELDADGHPTRNRVLRTSRGTINDTVVNWKVHESWYDPSFYPLIEVAARQFVVPQLKRKRRISVLLPHDYYKHPQRRYPVLYLQDGQNLFESTAPYGTWGVDRQLARLAQEGQGGTIIVAIDHGGKQRVEEYSPVNTRQFGLGLGKDYARFLTETLKPFIDQKYRTLSDRANTGIGGSSMGGLISLYAGLLFPEVYSKYMIFSPSIWLTPGMFEAFRVSNLRPDSRFYFFVGGKEPKGTVRNTELLSQVIASRTVPNVHSTIQIDPEAGHQEHFWGKAFGGGLKWLFKS
jgi:predicted alpha/beta superfamily hydrolase